MSVYSFRFKWLAAILIWQKDRNHHLNRGKTNVLCVCFIDILCKSNSIYLGPILLAQFNFTANEDK